MASAMATTEMLPSFCLDASTGLRFTIVKIT